MIGGRMVLEVLRATARDPDVDLSLDGLARRSGWSASYLHRAFTRVMAETPKQYALRVRLARAAAHLAASSRPVLEVALANGFGSHEVFIRAFRRMFACTPSAYRARALPGATAEARSLHQSVVEASAPCLRLHRMSTSPRSGPMSILSMQPGVAPARPIVFVRRQVSRAELATAIGECLGQAFGFAQTAGLAIAGRPFTRYAEMSHGLMTIEAGVPVAQPAAGGGAVVAGELPAGAELVALHAGAYDTLTETYAAMERWMAEHGRKAAGAPWESYLTDPMEHPDPAAWRTEVHWPMTD